MIDKIRTLYKKYEELVLYVICGGLTTLVNMLCMDCARYSWDFLPCFQFIAWVLSVLFAYVTNRTWVFKSKKRGRRQSAGIWTFCQRPGHVHAGDMVIMFFMCVGSPSSGTCGKDSGQYFCHDLYYVFSKLIIFRKR